MPAGKTGISQRTTLLAEKSAERTEDLSGYRFDLRDVLLQKCLRSAREKREGGQVA